MSTPEGLELLLEIEQLKQLKYRYMRSVDTKDWKLLAECLTPDAEARYGDSPEPCVGPEAIVEFVSKHIPFGVSSVHTLTQPEIRFTSDTTAEGAWALADVIVYEERQLVYRGAARYSDEYVKTDGQWRIHRTGYKRFYEEAMSVASGLSSSFGPGPGGWMMRAKADLHVGEDASG